MVICAVDIMYLKSALGIRKRFTHNALPQTYQLRMPVKTSEESEEEEN